MRLPCVLFVAFAAVILQVNGNDVEQNGLKGKQPRGMVLIDGKEFYISVYKTDGLNAVLICEDFAMRQVILDNPDKNSLIKKYILDNYGDDGSGYWMSARKLQTEFQWTGNNRVMTFTNWATGEPNQEVVWDVCTYFTPVSGWYDSTCTGINNYIVCEHIE